MKTEIVAINLESMPPQEKDNLIEFYVPQAIAIVDWFMANLPDKLHDAGSISEMVIGTLEEQGELIASLQAAKL